MSLRLVLLFALTGPRPASAAAGRILVAKDVVAYAMPTDDPLALPTAVAVGPGGEVYVADGVNSRVLQFRRDGTLVRTLRTVAGQALANPVALATSEDGSLWIADNGLGRVLVASGAPGLDHAVEVGGIFENDLELDLTGLAVSPDGSRLWLVDNDNHQVLRGDLSTGAWTVIGKQGDATGEMNFPSMAALGDDGALFVSDTLNGRVVGWSDEGRPTRPVGRYGVSAGQLFRPRGVAVGDGVVWVADGVLGVVQAFGTGGRLLDVLRDEDRQILRFDAPAGLAVDGDRLFVVELGADRVRELRIKRVSGQPIIAAVPPPVGAPAAQGRECTACHLEMMPELAQHTGGALIDSPQNRRGRPFVSSAEACLSCHDGTVLDSRREVWVLHGHPIGKKPPEDMVIPEGLPLSDGEMDCRTCHSAHTLGGSGQEHRNALMLRVTDKANELCVACHGDMMAAGGGK